MATPRGPADVADAALAGRQARARGRAECSRRTRPRPERARGRRPPRRTGPRRQRNGRSEPAAGDGRAAPARGRSEPAAGDPHAALAHGRSEPVAGDAQAHPPAAGASPRSRPSMPCSPAADATRAHAGRRRVRVVAANAWRVPWTCAAELVGLLDTRGDRIAAARTPTASSGSSTPRGPARGDGARWRPAGIATRRFATAAFAGPEWAAAHHGSLTRRVRRPTRIRLCAATRWSAAASPPASTAREWTHPCLRRQVFARRSATPRTRPDQSASARRDAVRRRVAAGHDRARVNTYPC